MSNDGGAVWTLIKDIYGQLGCSMAICQDIPGVVLFGGKSTYGRMFRSTDYGDNWSTVLAPDVRYSNDIEVDPFNSAHILECSFTPSSLITSFSESFDHGENWVESDYSLIPGKANDILFSSIVEGRLICATSTGIYVSDDGMNFDHVLECETLQLEADPDRPFEMYAACANDGVYRSFDSGSTWEQMSDLYPEPVRVECIEIVNNNWLYAGTHLYGTFRYALEPLGLTEYETSTSVASPISILTSPALNTVTIVVNPLEYSRTLSVFDLSGRMVHTEPITVSEAVQYIQVTDLAPGVYFTGLTNQQTYNRFVLLGH